MADAAGATVGVISLGLQVLQGLALYYSQYTSFSTEISASVQRIKSLSAILEFLSTTVGKLDGEEPVSAEVQRCISECEAGVRNLQTHLKKCGEVKLVPDTLEDKMRLVTKKLLFPFRKATLEDLQKTLDRLQGNVDTVVLALQLDMTLSHDELEGKRASMMSEELGLVRRRQTYGIELLEEVGSKTSTQVDRILISQSHTESSLDEIGSQFNQLRAIQDSVVEQLQEMSTSISTMQSTRRVTPSALGETCNAYVDIVRPIRTLARKQNRFDRHSIQGQFTCTCPALPRTCKRINQWWLGSSYSQATSCHSPNCPYYGISLRSRTIGVQLTACSRFLGCMIEASLTWGNKFISPQLTYWNVVQRDCSPAFRLSRLLYFYWLRNLDYNEQEQAVQLIQKSLVLLLCTKRASVLDVLDGGWTLLHEICQCLMYLYDDSDEGDHDEIFRETMAFWLNIGMSSFESTDSLRGLGTVLDLVLHNSCVSQNTRLFKYIPFFIDAGCSWSIDAVIRGIDAYWAPFMPPPMTLQEIPIASVVYDASDDSMLLRSVFRRSTTDLQIVIRDMESGDCDITESALFYAVADWQEGLETVLLREESGALCPTRAAVDALLFACTVNNPDTVRILLHAGFPVTGNTWRLVCGFDTSRQRITKQICGALYWQFKNGQNYGSTEFPTLQHIPGSKTISRSPYHFQYMTVDTADILFQTGVCCIDQDTPHSTIGLWYQGTALWYHTHSFASLGHCEDRIKCARLIRWFVEKGSRLHHPHPAFSSTPAQHIAEGVAKHIFTAFIRLGNHPKWTTARSNLLCACDEDFLPFYRDVFTSKGKDKCRCACSVHGCDISISVFNIYAAQGYQLTEILLNRFYSELGLNMETMLEASSIIRVLIFARLGLTHTCHSSHESSGLLDEKEVADIQYVEREDISFLDDLVAEFDRALQTYAGSTMGFIATMFKPRMDEVMKARLTPRSDELQRAEELGVVFYGPEPEMVREPKRRTYEWFEWEVARIMGDVGL